MLGEREVVLVGSAVKRRMPWRWMSVGQGHLSCCEQEFVGLLFRRVPPLLDSLAAGSLGRLVR
jgi:hypothetical protein